MKNPSMIYCFVCATEIRREREQAGRSAVVHGTLRHASIDFVYILIKLYPSSVAIEGVLPT